MIPGFLNHGGACSSRLCGIAWDQFPLVVTEYSFYIMVTFSCKGCDSPPCHPITDVAADWWFKMTTTKRYQTATLLSKVTFCLNSQEQTLLRTVLSSWPHTTFTYKYSYYKNQNPIKLSTQTTSANKRRWSCLYWEMVGQENFPIWTLTPRPVLTILTGSGSDRERERASGGLLLLWFEVSSVLSVWKQVSDGLIPCTKLQARRHS